jgi:hypothetical protein
VQLTGAVIARAYRGDDPTALLNLARAEMQKKRNSGRGHGRGQSWTRLVFFFLLSIFYNALQIKNISLFLRYRCELRQRMLEGASERVKANTLHSLFHHALTITGAERSTHL